MIEVEPGATCLEQDRLLERIARWRQRAPLDASIRVKVHGDPAQPTRVFFSVSRAGSQPSERVLDNAPSDCDQLHSAVALSIALAIDAMISGQEGLLPAVPPPEPTPPPTAARQPPRAAAGGPAMYAEIGLLAGASVGVVTNPAVAGVPRLQFAPVPWLVFAIAGFATRTQNATIGDVPGEFTATVLAGGADVCFGGETVERLSFFMCGGARAGQFVADATGSPFRERYRTSEPWWAVSASGQARAWIVPAVAVGISVEALVSLASRDLELTGLMGAPSVTRHISQLGLSVAAGPVFRFF